jgi:broad specificity phosphatase PhoE
VSRGHDAVVRLASARPLRVAEQPFLFLRHGETAGNFSRIYQHPNEPLNATGIAQARRAALALHACRPDRILASTMRRAWQTAGIVGQALHLPVMEAPGLRERHFGALIGTSSVGLDWAAEPPEGEALQDFVDRTRGGLAEALAGEGTPLLVAHGGTLLVLTAALGCAFTAETARNATPLLFAPGADGWRMESLAAPVESGGGVVFT